MSAVAAAALAAAGCSSGGGSTSSPASTEKAGAADNATVVTLKSLAFNPARVTVPVGTTVTWRNEEPISHDVTSGKVSGVDKTTGLRAQQTADGLFEGALANSGDTYSYTFKKAGTFSYFCSIHQGMNGSVVVTP